MFAKLQQTNCNGILPMPKQELLKDTFDYDPHTGVLKWKARPGLSKAWNARFSGKIAGRVSSGGRRQVSVENKRYLSSRLIWMLVYGLDPGSHVIDHIDGDPLNDALENLRIATQSQNNINQKRFRTNPPQGYTFKKNIRKFLVRVPVNGKSRTLGYFDSEEKAKKAYYEYMRKSYGEFMPC